MIMVLLPRRSRHSRSSRPPGGGDTELGLPISWNNISPFPEPSNTSAHRSSFFHEPPSSPSSPVIATLLSPPTPREEGVFPAHISPCPTNSRRGSLKRKPGDDDDGSDDNSVSLPGVKTFLPYRKSPKLSHATSRLWTPSSSPDLSEDDVYLRGPGLLLAQDPIIEKLNRLRMVENKNPLPPLEGLYDQEFLNQATRKWVTLQNIHGETCQPPTPLQDTRRRRAKCEQTSHCNIKYLIEELDYIRYQRVDLAQSWSLVEANFSTLFPMTVFPEPRKRQGLQGVNYRQNKCLPRLSNGQLVFMDNGHVEPVCVKTREQIEMKHLYTLVHLFPDRAMKYPWVSLMDKQRAYKLHEERQIQMEKGRLEAIERGTYVERLPSDVLCGCCPGEDREREKKCPKNRTFSKKIRHDPEQGRSHTMKIPLRSPIG
ncbi:hypothetical protein F5X98DRAFT_48828 [Xylaria grammica]|nr:hypothetical protein F5X98DRAFT_48828 [Xylaria grammica]